MTVDVKSMGITEYLGQGTYWIDPSSGSVFEIVQMDDDRRVKVARNLLFRSTALISLAEAEALRLGNLPAALHLANREPRKWMIATALYRALYPGPRAADDSSSEAEFSGNRSAVPRVSYASDATPS